MRSKTSFSEYFNPTLFRRNLTRFWPLWGMATFFACLAPLAMLTQIMWNDIKSLDPLEVTQGYYAIVSYVVPIVSLLYAILCAMAVWSYLCNARSVGMIHTLPIRREGLLLTNFLSGMAMLLIPYAATGALTIGIVAAMGGFDLKGTLVTIIAVIGLNFFYFCTATFTAFITGNVFALPALYILLHFLAVMADALFGILSRNFLFGVATDYSGKVDFLSPTVYFFQHLGYACDYETVQKTLSNGRVVENEVLSAVHFPNGWLIAVYALVGAGLLALAWVLYRRRQSERAGEVAAAKWMHPAYRALASVLCGILGGQLLYVLFWSGYQKGEHYDAVPLAVFMTIAGVIGYFAASMLLAKSLKVFQKKRLLGAVGVAVFAFALCLGLDADVLGIERAVPKTADIKSLTVAVASNRYDLTPGKDDALIEEVRALHKAIIADRDYIESGPEAYTQPADAGQMYDWESIYLTYMGKDGKQVSRRYYLTLTKDRMAQSGTYDYLLDALVNGEAMKLRRLHADQPEYELTAASFYNEFTGDDISLGTRETQAVMEAVGKDAAAGTWGTYDWFDDAYGDEYAVNLEMRFHREADETENLSTSDWITIKVRPEMSNTVACLKDLGIATDETLLTQKELNDWYDKGGGEYYPPSVYPEASEIVEPADAYVAPSESAAMGIIGGADGPTAVLVNGG